MKRAAPDMASDGGRSGVVSALRVVLAIIMFAAITLLGYRFMGPRPSRDEPGQGTAEPPAAEPEVVNAMERPGVRAVVGRQYRVVIEDQSERTGDGIAKIGGLVTFVPGAKAGEEHTVKVIKRKRSSAEAVIVEEGAASTETPKRAPRHPGGRRETVEVGKTYRGVVVDVGKKGDAIVKIGGKVVFVPGAKVGDEVSFVVTDDMGRFAQAHLLSCVPGDEEAQREAAAVLDKARSGADEVQEGREFEVVVTEKDRKNPDSNGVARIDGLVVFVPNSQPGDRVKIRITARRPRFAFSEVVERVPSD